MAYVYVPVVQRELDDFREMVWNNKKGRNQPKKALPHAKAPTLLYEFPEKCGSYENYGIHVSDDDFNSLDNLDVLEPIFEGEVNTYIPVEFTSILDRIHEEGGLESLETLELDNANQVYLYLRREFRKLSVS